MTQGKSQVKLLTIQKFADICGTTPKALRLYESKGILRPFKIDLANKYRFYSFEQAKDLMYIKLFQNFGFSLTEIKSLLRKHNLTDFINQKINTKQFEIIEKQKEKDFLVYIKKFLLEKANSKQIIKTEIGPFKLITKVVKDGDYSKIAQYLTDLRKVADELKIETGSDEFAFYLDQNYKPQHTMLEVAFEIEDDNLPENLSLPEGITIKDFNITTVRIYKYKGPYEYLNLIYQKLIQDYKIHNSKEAFFDIYKNPSKEISKYDLLTEIVFPQS